MSEAIKKSHKLPSFEGLRGIGALIVVFYHLRLTLFPDLAAFVSKNFEFLPSKLPRLIEVFIDGLTNGTFAVWLFWIMSGLVLSLQFFLRAREISTPQSHRYLEEALIRRYPRLLLPVLASVLFAYLLFATGCMYNTVFANALSGTRNTYWISQWYTFTPGAISALKSAFWSAFFIYQAPTYNNVLWTMQEEFYGSLFLFAFLGVLGHSRTRYLAYFVISVLNYALGLNWLTAFVIGIAFSDLYVNRDHFYRFKNSLIFSKILFIRRSRLLMAMLWFLFFVSAGHTKNDLLYLITATAAIAFTLISLPTQKILASRIPCFLGNISFGLYLIHVPIICSFTCWAYLKFFRVMGATSTLLLVSLATLALSLMGGYGLYLLVDRPAVRLSRWISNGIMQILDKSKKRSAS